MAIVFVGDKASKKNIDSDIPFVGTQSYKRLLEWIWRMDVNINEVRMINKDQCSLLYIDYLRNKSHKIVALGKNAQLELMDYDLEHFYLPHPSGLNRKLNDEKYVKKMLKECKEYIHGR